jgi:DNA polymerase III subunit delta
VLYLVLGKDEFQREEFVGQLKTKMRQLPMGEHNVDELGSDATVRDVVNAASTMPFLCDKRMVIARGLLARSSRSRTSRTRGAQRAEPALNPLDELRSFLAEMPESTHLVLVDEDGAAARTLEGVRKDTVKREFQPLREDALPGWVMDRAKRYHTPIARPAAQELAQLVGPDLRTLDHELAKLATYGEPGQTIQVEDVRTLVAGGGPTIFALHDALAERRAGPAVNAVQGLLVRGTDPMELFAQVVGLVRRLLIVKELTNQHRPLTKEAPTFGLSSSQFALQKLQRQAARISMEELERAFEALRDADLAIKTGKLDPEMALELALAHLLGLKEELPVPFSSGRRPG